MNLFRFVTVAMPAGVDMKEAARLADMDTGEFESLNAAYAQPHQYTAPMRAIIRVDKITGFFERVREFLQKNELRRASQSTNAGKPSKPVATACCQRR